MQVLLWDEEQVISMEQCLMVVKQDPLPLVLVWDSPRVEQVIFLLHLDVDGTDHYRDLSIKCELNIFILYRKRIDSSEKCARIKKKRILDTRDLSKVDETTGSRFICLAFFV